MASGDVAFEVTTVPITEQDDVSGTVTSTLGAYPAAVVTVPASVGGSAQAHFSGGTLVVRVGLNGSSSDPLFDQDKTYKITVTEV